MKSYTLVYLKFFKYTVADFIPCEVCGNRAVDIHHIEARSRRKDLLNDITNLMALCRICHDRYGDKTKHKQFLINKHAEKIETFNPN